MKFSEHWLREWVNPPVSATDIAEQITMAGLEVDEVVPAAEAFSGVVVAEVKAVEPHPDADKLNVCVVSNGTEDLQVVCGARNVAAGMKVPLAQVGARLAGDFKIKKSKLRGVESHGMICAAQELGLAEKSDGIMPLPEDAPVGESFWEYLGLDDWSIDVDLTPNRGDCLSIAGLAREVGVINQQAVNMPVIDPVAPVIDDTLPVTLDAGDACPRYVGRIVRNVDVSRPTPLWMSERLRRCGVRTIDPVVDITNYVLLELGQPMHAFDLAQVEGGIRVRYAEADESLTLLDGEHYTLRADTLVIADQQRPLAMAGIMGGEASAVGAQTRDILLESAFFNPLAIAGKARGYGLHTDSSHRFERGVDPQQQRRAIERATALILQWVGGEPGPVFEAVADAHLPDTAEVTLRYARLTSLLGVDIARTQVEEILSRLGLECVSQDRDSWVYRVPSHRFDIRIEQDLIEEVGRIYGYNRFPESRPHGEQKLRLQPETNTRSTVIRQYMLAQGFNEAITYSFVDEGRQQQVSPDLEAVPLANPIASDMGVMRTSLLTGLLDALHYNQARQQQSLRLFETGLRFFKQGNETVQEPMFAGVMAGTREVANWSNERASLDFFDAKGLLEGLFDRLKLDALVFEKGEHPAYHPGQCARILHHENVVGFVGRIHPFLHKSLNLNGSVYFFELSLNSISEGKLPVFVEPSKFPETRRDLALLVKQSVSVADLMAVIREVGGEHLVDIRVFDVYAGEGVGADERSVALTLAWQHRERTLQDDEINQIVAHVVKNLEEKTGALLRG